MSSEQTLHAKWSRALLALALGLGAAALLFVAIRAVGETVTDVLFRSPRLILGWQAALWAAVIAGRVLWFIGSRARVPRRAVALSFLVGAAVWVVHAMLPSVGRGRPQGATFGDLQVLPANTSYEDRFPHRPTVHVETNAFGFRGPPLSEAKPAGTTRIALIGDSFVFGSGVEWPDTLAMTLSAALERAAPARRFEVVDLGVAGDHLLSEVSEYQEVVRRFAPDAVVMGVGYVDFARRDIQSVLHEQANPGFHLVTVLMGEQFAQWAWMVQAEPPSFAEARQVAEEGTATLARLRARGGPPLLFLEYHTLPPGIRLALSRVPGTTWVEMPRDDPSWWLPIDGHPSPAGNRVFAAALVPPLLARLPPAAR